MGALLKSGKVGNINNDHMKTVRKEIIERWDGLGLLEGLKGYNKENIAQMYENEASWMLNEATALGSEGSFETVVFPIVRRVFSKLLANEIVSVQALNLPIGRLYYFRPKIGNSQFTTGDKQGGGVAINANNSNTDLYDSFYGDNGLFDNSKGPVTYVSGTTTSTTYQFDKTTANGYSSKGTTTIADGTTEIIKFNFPGLPTGFDQQEDFLSSMAVTIAGYGTVLDFYLPAQKYSQALMASNGDLYVAVVNSTGAAITVSNIVADAKIYGSLELEDQMGEVSFELDSITVSVIERKLRAQWSPELAQDVSAFHNLDAEAELTALLSEQIAAEIDREILRDLRRGAAWRLSWDYAGATGRGIDTSNAAAFYTQKEWNQTLTTAINQCSAQIHKATLRGGANWIVCSAEVSAIFDDLEYFHVSNAAPEQDKYNMGIEKVGALGGRYQVYRDPYFPADTILLGHKGTSLLDTGYIYAPYVPLQLTPTMYNPFTFAPVKGIMTRYAKKMVNNRFYATIKVKNIVSFSIDALR